MKTMPVGELKRRFSEVIEAVKNGVKLGLLSDKAKCEFTDEFEMTTDEMIGV